MYNAKIIVLDAGHGGTDAGAVNGTRYEKNDNLKLALAVQKQLALWGQTVLMTRTDDTFHSLVSRTDKANAAEADLFVSLHRNSVATATANGVEIWVYTTAGSGVQGMAAAVLERIAAVGIQSNRGVKMGNYHVLRESNMPAMLVELGFLSNTADNRLFDLYFDEYALAIAQGICDALGIQIGEAEPVPPEALYRVQVGAFASRANAEAFLQTVRGMGLDAFLVSPDENNTK